MIKTLIFFFSITLFSQRVKSQYRYKLNIISNAIFNGKEIILTIENSEIMNREVLKSSAKISNSMAELKGMMHEVSKKALLSMVLRGELYQTEFVLDTGNNNIRIDSIDNYRRSLALTLPNTRSNKLKNEINSLTSIAYATQRKETKKIDGPTMLSLNNAVKLDKLIFDNLNINNDLYYSLIVLNDKSRNFEMIRQDSLLLTVFNKFNDSVKNTSFGKKFYERRVSNLKKYDRFKTGEKLSNFSIFQPNGQKFETISMFGKPYLIVFSATWCLPCIKEMRPLQGRFPFNLLNDNKLTT